VVDTNGPLVVEGFAILEAIEPLLWIIGGTAFYFYLRNRVNAAVRQIRIENAIRQAIKEAERKKKVDALYGRDRK
jgi:predicted membrane-bound dolichyl-phosphate-mannose-protein mannosyltransferase